MNTKLGLGCSLAVLAVCCLIIGLKSWPAPGEMMFYGSKDPGHVADLQHAAEQFDKATNALHAVPEVPQGLAPAETDPRLYYAVQAMNRLNATKKLEAADLSAAERTRISSELQQAEVWIDSYKQAEATLDAKRKILQNDLYAANRDLNAARSAAADRLVPIPHSELPWYNQVNTLHFVPASGAIGALAALFIVAGWPRRRA